MPAPVKTPPPPPPPSGFSAPPPPPPPSSFSAPPPPPPPSSSSTVASPPPETEVIPLPASSFERSEYIPSRKTNFTCPYCMSQIYIGDLKYYCPKKHADDRPNTYTAEEVQKYNLSRIVAKQVYCCNNPITNNRVCPVCELIYEESKKEGGSASLRILPPGTYNTKNELRICMTGYSSSGKTQYATQLCDYIAKYSLPGVDTIAFMDEETRSIREAIRKKFFEDRIIEATGSGYLEPMLFLIESGKRSYASVFYDIAGGDFQGNHDTIATKCIWTSDNIILIIDPTTLDKENMNETAQQFIKAGFGSPGETFDPVNSYRNFVSQFHQKGEKHIKKVNLAIVFSKMDLFYTDEDFPVILKQESKHIQAGRFNNNEADAVSNAMKKWLTSMGGQMTVNWINKYKNIRLFGVSSGSVENNTPPNRILDPYLWLLAQNGVLR